MIPRNLLRHCHAFLQLLQHQLCCHLPLGAQRRVCRQWLPSNHWHVPKDLIDQWFLELAWKKSRSLAPKPLERICPWTSSPLSGVGRCLFVRIHSSMSVSTMRSLQLLQQFGLQKAQRLGLYVPLGGGHAGACLLHAGLLCVGPMWNHHPWVRRLDPRRLLHSRAGHTKWPHPAKTPLHPQQCHHPPPLKS